MATTTALLPTSPLAVESWLRTLADESALLKMREAGESEYPYLFGLATVKLSEAHAEYLRLVQRQAALTAEADIAGKEITELRRTIVRETRNR